MHAERERFTEAAANFYGIFGGCLAILVGIVVIGNPSQASTLRLILTVCFFLALIGLLSALTQPLRDFLMARYALRYFDSGPALERTWKLFVHNLSTLIAVVSFAFMFVAGALMVRVLAQWPQFAVLMPLAALFESLWWLVMAVVPVSLLLYRGVLTRLLQSGQQLRDQVVTSDFQPVDIVDASEERALPPVEILDRERFRAGGFDWNWDDFFKNVIVFGQPGSGKTACVLNALLDSLVGSTAPQFGGQAASGLLLDPKGDFRIKIGQVMDRHGRAGDLLVIDPEAPSQSMRWNPLDSDENALELANAFVAVLRVLGMKNEQDTFWIDAARTFVRHAITLLRGVADAAVPPGLIDVAEAAGSLKEVRGLTLMAAAVALQRETDPTAGWSGVRVLLADIDALHRTANALVPDDARTFRLRRFFVGFFAGEPEDRRPWLESAWRRLEMRAMAHGKEGPLPVGQLDLESITYVVDTWLDMPDDTRGGVQSYLSNMLDPFVTEPYRTLFSGASTTRMSTALDAGQVIYVHMPIAKAETMAKVVGTFVKLDYYREVLKRLGKERPSFFFCDEFQSFFTVGDGKGDADFFERSRQSRHANLIATQNLEALFKLTREEAPIRNLLANCGTKIFLRNTDGRTNTYGSELFGEALEDVVTAGRSGATSVRGAGPGSTTLSTTAQYGAVVRKEAFTRLAQPSAADGIDFAESIIHLGSRGRIERLRLRWPLYLFD